VESAYEVMHVAALLEPTPYLTAEERAGLPAAHHHAWTVVTAVEVTLAGVAVLADLLVPSLVMLALAGVSLLVRRRGVGSLGFHRAAALPLAGKALVFAAAWSLFQFGLTMPIANHVSGHETDLSQFADVEGNAGRLLALLLLSWTIAAVGEEFAYRGYLQTRLRELFGSSRAGVAVAVAVSSVLFGVAHSEQGIIGVVVITLDGVAFSAVRYRLRTLWAAVLVHGFNNTIRFVTFFVAGPVYGLW